MKIASILMCTKNTNGHFHESVASVLREINSDMEFVLVHDSAEKKYMPTSLYIKVIKNESNLGLTQSLNKGLNYCHSKYIIRMDSDDVVLPGRFLKQIEFMEKHPEIGICGTWVEAFNSTRREIWTYPQDYRQTEVQLAFRPAFAHPSIIIRKSVIDRYGIIYNVNYKYAQDYSLALDVAKVSKIANMPDVLLRYRMHENQIGGEKKYFQDECARKIREEKLIHDMPYVTKIQKTIHQAVGSMDYGNPEISLMAYHNWFLTFLAGTWKRYSAKHMIIFLSIEWLKILKSKYKRKMTSAVILAIVSPLTYLGLVTFFFQDRLKKRVLQKNEY